MPAVAPELGGVGHREWRHVDDTQAWYAPLSEDFYFVESCCKNEGYDDKCVFIPVQHKDFTCHIYKLDVTVIGSVPERLMQVIKPDGEVEISPFGSALSKDGVMWICAFNENKLLAVDMKEKAVVATIKCPAPNDVDLSDDEKWVYAACGSRMGKVRVAAGRGNVFRVTSEVGTPKKPKLARAAMYMQRCDGTMAGIAERNSKIFCAHLQRMTEYHPKAHVPGTPAITTRKRFWDGYGDPVDKYFLCDNLTWWSHSQLLTPCYRTVPGHIGYLLDQVPSIACVGWACARVATTFRRLHEEGLEEVLKVNDDGISPEVDLSFSMGDEFKDVHFSVHNIETGATHNYRMECDGVKFDGHVTHADRFANNVVLINFQKNRIGVVPETAFEAPM